MGIIPTDIIEVVMLAGDTHTFLRIDRTRIWALVGAQEHILELDHARVGKKKSAIPTRDKRHGRHSCVSMLDEEVDEGLADLIACHFFSHLDLKS
jgi:hypothetical protein